jgi:hypothetical protein
MADFEFGEGADDGVIWGKEVVELGEVGVAFDFAENDGEEEIAAMWEEARVNLGAADDEDLAFRAIFREGGDPAGEASDEPNFAGGDALEAELICFAAQARGPMADERRRSAFFNKGAVSREKARCAGEDDVGSIWKRLGQAREGLPAHEDNATGGEFLEPTKVVRQMPGDFAAASDDAVHGHCRNGFQSGTEVAGGGGGGGAGASSTS